MHGPFLRRADGPLRPPSPGTACDRPEPAGHLPALVVHRHLGRQPDRHRGDDRHLRRSAAHPLPARHGRGAAGEAAGAAQLAVRAAEPEAGDERMWTARVRTWAARTLPPKKLVPDRQPAYVASWVYVFGVATLVALGIAIVSGFG